MRSSIASEPVTKPARPAQGVPRPSMETPTTRPTPCLLNASAAGRVKPAKAASTDGARGSAGVSQKTASAPANALSATAASPCEPSTMSGSSRTSAGSCDGSRAMTRSCSPLSSRLPSTWRPIWPVGVVMTITGTSNAGDDSACGHVCGVCPSRHRAVPGRPTGIRRMTAQCGRLLRGQRALLPVLTTACTRTAWGRCGRGCRRS